MKEINKLTQNHYFFGLTGMAAGYAISALIGAIATAAGTATNAISTAVTNKKNEDLTREAWTRDDMQLQRARQDAEKAGFSPLAALSNNLTNTAPATMQAPQIDASAIGNSISNVGRAYGEGKYNKEQVEALKIENKFNRQDLFNRRLQSVAQTAKLIKEVQGMDLDSAQKAQLLIDGGVEPSTVAKFFKPAAEMSRSTMATAQENLVKAQTNLTIKQKDETDAKMNLENAQKALAETQKVTSKEQHDFWFAPLNDPKWNIQYPYAIDKDGNIQYATLEASGRNRTELLQLYNQYVSEFEQKLTKQEMDFDKKMKIWDNVNKSVSSVMSFFKPISLQ